MIVDNIDLNEDVMNVYLNYWHYFMSKLINI